MRKITALLMLFFLINAQRIFCQTPTSKQPIVIGKTNDWEGIFSDTQKSQIDSVSVIFAFTTNIPISIITFGAANTTEGGADAFVDHTDSLMFQNHDDAPIMGIFLSKEFRTLNFQVHTPAGADTSKLADWKVKMKQVFTTSAQPNIPLLKDGKYTEALIAIIADLAVAVKKEL